ncbi:golgin subfamily A member 6-like protein 7 [Strongylocentrotus purpuratus]|uniref:DUF8117 domain-containing protein n=1 Tax=Strongylocentrotus purpuratus TaxID=7668 RepID=A0A7M7HIC2_STRPU|nr:golgin subfamily A member 6-like protein 7 [Strongylocentrotus purpuratus]XP_011670174.1 golgin subfamily A member 6-like protein 7 [Strongylocentrotus purpuratus]|eukprot:XP_003724585.1 PREDICTED: uncharacterized protein LOC100890795 [Strongylocentrotus purpuratus]
MRLIQIDYSQDSLFGKKVCNENAAFFRKHKESYKRMIVEQGRHFWIYFSVSFKAYCLNNGILEISGISSDMTFTNMIEEVLEVTDQMLTNGHVKDGLKLCEDLITLFQYRSFIDEIQSQTIMTNPFYMRDSEDTFRRLFGKPMEDKTLHLIKVVKTLQFLLHLGGCLFEMLRLWLQAEECKQDVTLYWKPPPEKPFHLFGDNSPTLVKACTVINKYEKSILDKTMYALQEDSKEGRNLVNVKIEHNSEDSGDDDPVKQRYKSKKLSIVIENEDTKEVKKKVKLKYPRWNTTSYSRHPNECPGCHDHLECIRKQVIGQGFVLPQVFEVHYEPNFHVKIRHCSHCNERMHECESPLHHNTGETVQRPMIPVAKRKDKGVTRTAQKQMAKKERRIQRKKHVGKESLDKLEAEGLQKFVDECRKVPGFIEELERTQPKKIVGVSLPKRRVKPPMPNPKAGACRIRILDPGGNEADGEQNRKIEKEMKKKIEMSGAGEYKECYFEPEKESEDGDIESKDEENKQWGKEPQRAGDKEKENKGEDSENATTNVGNDETPKEEEQPPVKEVEQKEQVPGKEKEQNEQQPDKKMKQKEQVSGPEMKQKEHISGTEMKQKEHIPDTEMEPKKQVPGTEVKQDNQVPDTKMTQKEHVPGTEMKQKVQVPGPKQKEQVPAITNQPAEAGCCTAQDERKSVDRLKDHPAEASKETTKSVDIGMSDEFTEMKISNLRQCALCGKHEDKPKTYKKCQQCRQQKIKPGKYYCSRDCQVQDWKRRHCQEHLERDREAERMQCKGDNNGELAMDQRRDVNKAALLNDVE